MSVSHVDLSEDNLRDGEQHGAGHADREPGQRSPVVVGVGVGGAAVRGSLQLGLFSLGLVAFPCLVTKLLRVAISMRKGCHADGVQRLKGPSESTSSCPYELLLSKGIDPYKTDLYLEGSSAGLANVGVSAPESVRLGIPGLPLVERHAAEDGGLVGAGQYEADAFVGLASRLLQGRLIGQNDCGGANSFGLMQLNEK